MSSTNATSTIDQYAWVRPAWPAPSPDCDWAVACPYELANELDSLPPQKLSFDTETTGLRYWVPGFGMQSIAVYTPASQKLLAVNMLGSTELERSVVIKALIRHKLYAFNAQFDMGVLYAVNESLPKRLKVDSEELLFSLGGCSQVFFRQATKEGYNIHSLEMAQKNLFGWEDSQKDWLSQALESAGLSKDQMWRLLETEHREGFLYYNAMDARSAWLVWSHLCSEARRVEREGMISLQEAEFATLIRDCIRQAFTGMPLDRKKMRSILVDSFRRKAAIHTELRNDERIKPFIDRWEAERIIEQWQLDITLREKPISDNKIVADALAGYGVEDDQAEGSTDEIRDEETKAIVSKPGPALLTPDGQLALPSYKVSLKGGNKFPGFSFSSPDHLKHLLYGHLATYDVAYKKRQGQDELVRWAINYGGKQYVVAATDSGDLPTGADIYPVFGDIGKKLEDAAEADTRFGFAKSYLAAASETKRIHTQLKVHGAGTGRCSGGSGGKNKNNLSINLQQAPRRDREFMECFPAPKGLYYFSSDFRGLEKVVQAELSGDPVLTRLYASGEKHDVHLFHTMKIHPDPMVREAIGGQYTTDPAVLKMLKAQFTPERDFSKMESFAFDYGSGAENIALKANIEGIMINGRAVTVEDIQESRSLYIDLYKVYYAWCEEKKKEWEARGGWIEDGFGFPIAIAPYPLDRHGYPVALKDAGSKVVQCTGHYILMTWLKHIENIKREEGLWKLERPVICDLHDERIVLTPDPEACNALHLRALERTNDELSPKIRFELASEYGTTLYDCKKS